MDVDTVKQPSVSESINRLDAETLQFLHRRLEEKRKEARIFLVSARKANTRRGKYELLRESFDSTNKFHLESYLMFLKTGNWGNIRFFVEYPFDTVTETVHYKFAIHELDKILNTGDKIFGKHAA